jgi:hypothetical protein
MTDLLPILIWMLAPVVAALRRPGRAAFVTAVVVAIAIEAVGAFAYTGVTDLPIYAAPDGAGRLRPAWEWRNAPFIASLWRGRAPAELLTPMRGSIDAVEAGGRVTDTIAAGEDVVASGWAVAGHATPLQVAITIDGDESAIAAVRAFHNRPDIRRVLPGNGPVGWRIPLQTAQLAPGRHQLALYSWASENGGVYYLARRTLNVKAVPAQTPAPAVAPSDEDTLEASASTAVARIREDQQAPGYWLTAFTGAARFEQPRAEMNTFLTSLLVDLLDPVAAATGLSDNLRRARQHLTAQIEADGLVRYHGLPDAPGIGTLGCVITPDADDTALVWRIAPADDRGRLAAALTTTRGYRTADGLYRTWLAPRAAYQCLDPGRDPNPTDIAIQLHMLQWLLRAAPPAGRALCGALSQRLDDDRIWVYYRMTPLVPILRTASLARAGCRLQLPESRMRTEVPGQEIWVALVRLLSEDWRGAPASQAAAASGILRQLAANDFARLRESPPLLYHNDLSATVPRYYWSADAGYALWLRLDARIASVADRTGRPLPSPRLR